MISTRAKLKIKVKEWIDQKTDPFTTLQVQSELKNVSKIISTSTHRLAHYIRATQKVDYDKNKKLWNVRLKPNTHGEDKNATKK